MSLKMSWPMPGCAAAVAVVRLDEGSDLLDYPSFLAGALMLPLRGEAASPIRASPAGDEIS